MPKSWTRSRLAGRVVSGATLAAATFAAGFAPTHPARAEDPPQAQAVAPRPNVVLVVVDDLNHDLGFSGADVQTPNFDRLAERGLVFTNAHTNAPVCNPSRTSFLLGQYPPTTGVQENNTYFRELPHLRDAVTLPQHFRENGYHTVGAGKIFHHGWRPNRNQQNRFLDRSASWDQYAQIKHGTPWPRPRPNNWHQGQVRTWWGKSFWWKAMDFDDAETGDWKNAAHIAEHLAPPLPDKPMFLACGIFRPHVPFVAAQKYFDLYDLPDTPTESLAGYLENDVNDLPPTARKWANKTGLHRALMRQNMWDDAVEAYRASTTYADACFGQVLDAYDRSPARDHTYLIVTSDHGFQLGEKGAWTKFSFWERTTRVPFIVIGPGIEPGVSERTVSLIDLYPTLIALAGLPERDGLEGQDISPLFDDPHRPWDSVARVFHEAAENEAVIDEEFRYIRYANGDEELYDRRADPHDWHNLATDPTYADVLERYRAKRWFAEP
ncbi:MAG: sulfatase [Planctomycetota bacterium]